MSYLVISCPHCNQKIFTLETEINCKIFRCGILKSDYSQIDPHFLIFFFIYFQHFHPDSK